MGYTNIADFGVKDYGGEELTIRIIDEDSGNSSTSDFDKEMIDNIIKTLQLVRYKKWGVDNG